MDTLDQKIIDYLNKVISKNDSDILTLFQSISNEKIKKPIIYLDSSTNGIISGIKHTEEAIKKYLEINKIDADIIYVGCAGFCSYGPIIDIQLPGRTRVSFKEVAKEKVNSIFDEIFYNIISHENVIGQYPSENNKEWDGVPYINEHLFFRKQKRILLENCGIIDPENIYEYIAKGGYIAFTKVVRNYTHCEIIDIVKKSKLRGRGGGGFSTGEKWKIAYNIASEKKYLICNADESDPGAYMDRLLIESDPHKIIEGIAIAAYAICANKAYIYIRNDYKLAIKRLNVAIEDARKLGLLGHNIFDSGFNLEIVIRKGAGAFVCGEETALISSIEGRRGMPTPKPPYPAEKGLYGNPTVINNVETLANIPNIVKHGPGWFNSLGTETSKGTKLFSVSGKIDFPGLIEVEMGTNFNDILYSLTSPLNEEINLKAIQIGGPSGYCISKKHFDITVDYNDLSDNGFGMGSGGLLVLDDKVCMVDLAKYFSNYFQKESCGKCIPCREGTKQLFEILQNITHRPVNETGNQTLERFKGVMQIERLAEVIQDTSLCGLGQNSANIVLSTLKEFRDEYEAHIFERKCSAGVCKDLCTYYIDVEKCTGCSVCAKKCPTEAIVGAPRQAYFVIEDKCIGCGICQDACKFGAVFMK